MKVALHTVAAKKQGASTAVIAGTIRGLMNAAPEHDYAVFANAELDIELPENVSRIDALIGGRISRLRWDQLEYPRLLKRIGADVSVAMFGFSAMRTPVPQVTILQNALYFCDKESRGDSLRAIGLERWLLRRAVGSAAATVVPSRTMAACVRNQFSAKRPVHTIPDAWEGSTAEIADREWGEPWKLVYVAHLERHKAHLDLIEIADELRRRGRVAVFWVSIAEVDDPELFERFTAEVARRRLEDNFEITGRLRRPEVNSRMRRADCFISPTRCESFGYSFIEAPAAGLPVVSSDIPIAREMLGAGARYFPPGDASTAADQVEWLYANADERVGLVEAARRHQSGFLIDWNEYGARLAGVIESAV